jgi:hypothetical protein
MVGRYLAPALASVLRRDAGEADEGVGKSFDFSDLHDPMIAGNRQGLQVHFEQWVIPFWHVS